MSPVSDATTTYTGGCHCGAVRFEIDAPRELSAIDCNCSICAKSGFLHVIVDSGDFRIVQGESDLTEYTFNTGTARHLFCSRCGIKPFYVPRSHPDGYSDNLKCLQLPDGLEVSHSDFDGRNWSRNISGWLDSKAGGNVKG